MSLDGISSSLIQRSLADIPTPLSTHAWIPLGPQEMFFQRRHL